MMTATTMNNKKESYSCRVCSIVPRVLLLILTVVSLALWRDSSRWRGNRSTAPPKKLLGASPEGHEVWLQDTTTTTTTTTTSIRKFAADDNPRVLNVHVVPHTHDDVGWCKTVDQYYYGFNNSIAELGNVRSIISTIVESLLDHPSRTFSYVEQKFFSMWWNEQNDAIRDSVRYLIANRQLIFVNGGWCMHDEAATHYASMIDQTSLGHDFLKRELGVVPRIGWQLDPFGHSATQASLMTSRVGFDALYFGRIDYQDLNLRRLTQECEGLWNSSSSLGDTTVFWGLTGSYGGNYGPPSGFWFDIHTGEKPLVGANQDFVLKKLHTFVEYIRLQSDQTKGNHIMMTMGSDFHVRAGHKLSLCDYRRF